MCFTALRPLSGCCSQLGLSFLQFLSTLLNRRNYLPFRSCCARINSRIFEFVARANFRDRETLDFARVFHVLPWDFCTFEIRDFGSLYRRARIALDALLRGFGRQGLIFTAYFQLRRHRNNLPCR
jgi:hypothetical protein